MSTLGGDDQVRRKKMPIVKIPVVSTDAALRLIPADAPIHRRPLRRRVLITG
jgi:hypothetical protein